MTSEDLQRRFDKLLKLSQKCRSYQVNWIRYKTDANWQSKLKAERELDNFLKRRTAADQ